MLQASPPNSTLTFLLASTVTSTPILLLRTSVIKSVGTPPNRVSRCTSNLSSPRVSSFQVAIPYPLSLLTLLLVRPSIPKIAISSPLLASTHSCPPPTSSGPPCGRTLTTSLP